MNLGLPKTPVDLAAPYALERFTDSSFESGGQDERDLALLDAAADQSGLLGGVVG